MTDQLSSVFISKGYHFLSFINLLGMILLIYSILNKCLHAFVVPSVCWRR